MRGRYLSHTPAADMHLRWKLFLGRRSSPARPNQLSSGGRGCQGELLRGGGRCLYIQRSGDVANNHPSHHHNSLSPKSSPLPEQPCRCRFPTDQRRPKRVPPRPLFWYDRISRLCASRHPCGAILHLQKNDLPSPASSTRSQHICVVAS